jgi:monoamine oxidase
MGWSRVPLSQLHGENARRSLDKCGVETLVNTSVTSIRGSAGSFSIETNSGHVTADRVIVATPPRTAASLGVVHDTQLADDLGVSPIVNIHFVFDRRVTELALGACLDSPIEFFFDRTDASGATSGQCLVVSLSAADRYMTIGSSELVATFLEELHRLMPRSREAKVVTSVVTREHAATFRATPGIEARRAAIASATPGVFLAGAWCNTGWPATMEGAVRSGNDSALLALSLGSLPISGGPQDLERVRA